MKTIIVLSLLTLLTACQTQPPLAQDPRVNPQMLSTNDLLKAQIDKMEKLERDMEKREQEMKYQHLKELTQMQIQQKQQPASAQGHANCKLLCF